MKTKKKLTKEEIDKLKNNKEALKNSNEIIKK